MHSSAAMGLHPPATGNSGTASTPSSPREKMKYTIAADERADMKLTLKIAAYFFDCDYTIEFNDGLGATVIARGKSWDCWLNDNGNLVIRSAK